jgi:hypothetical protein
VAQCRKLVFWIMHHSINEQVCSSADITN